MTNRTWEYKCSVCGLLCDFDEDEITENVQNVVKIWRI